VAVPDPVAARDERVAVLRSGPEPLSIQQVAAVLGVSKATAGRAALRVEARTMVPEQREG
jgi:hypothetical protein